MCTGQGVHKKFYLIVVDMQKSLRTTAPDVRVAVFGGGGCDIPSRTQTISKPPQFKTRNARSTLSISWWWWWFYPTHSWGWGRGSIPLNPNNRETPHGRDQRSRRERVEPKMARHRGSSTGQSSTRCERSCASEPQLLQEGVSARPTLWR